MEPAAVPTRIPAPVIARHFRAAVLESEHRGHVVVAAPGAAPFAMAGHPDHVVMLRSVIKPFALVALLTAPGAAALELSDAELAVMAGSHGGEDAHVRVLRSLVARTGLDPALLVCGKDDQPPLDHRTAVRLARRAATPGRLRHQCSGQHLALLLLARLLGEPDDRYPDAASATQRAVAAAVVGRLGPARGPLPMGMDGCGVPTWGMALADVATLHLALAAPPPEVGSPISAALDRVRSAMLLHPALSGGTAGRLDTDVMRFGGTRLTVKVGAEALVGLAVEPGRHPDGTPRPPLGIAVKIDDGDPTGRATTVAVMAVLDRLGLIPHAARRRLARYRSVAVRDAAGRTIARTVPADPETLRLPG